MPLIKPVKSEWYRYSIWIENSNSNEGFEWDLCPPCFPKLALKPQPIIDVTMVVVDEAQGHHNHKSKYDFNPSSSHGGGWWMADDDEFGDIRSMTPTGPHARGEPVHEQPTHTEIPL